MGDLHDEALRRSWGVEEGSAATVPASFVLRIEIGEVVTPWPCFMIAVRKEVLEKRYDEVEKMLSVIQVCFF